jgi:hypothetical protein
MFMSYFWIKIKLKVLLFSIIQNPYFRHFSFISGFVDTERLAPFTGVDIKRWKVKVMFWLTTLNELWVSYGLLTTEQEKDYGEANKIFVVIVFGVLVDHLQDEYLRQKTIRDMWDSLNTNYGGADASTELYIIE